MLQLAQLNDLVDRMKKAKFGALPDATQDTLKLTSPVEAGKIGTASVDCRLVVCAYGDNTPSAVPSPSTSKSKLALVEVPEALRSSLSVPPLSSGWS